MPAGAPKAKRWRRLGVAPTPKMARILGRRPFPPGQHGRTRRRGRASTYKEQLTEKQRLQALYGISERQLRNYVRAAQRHVADPVAPLLDTLERRLSTIVFRSFAPSMEAARQYVSHGHVQVNGQRVDRASYLVGVGDTVAIATKSEALRQAATAPYEPPPYLEVDRQGLSARLVTKPAPDQVPMLADVRKVLEFYS